MMLALLRALGTFILDLPKSRRRLQAENLFRMGMCLRVGCGRWAFATNRSLRDIPGKMAKRNV
jgi:hypothetical protein